MSAKTLILSVAGAGCLAAAGLAAYWAPRHEASVAVSPIAVVPEAPRAAEPVAPAPTKPSASPNARASATSRALDVAPPATAPAPAPPSKIEKPVSSTTHPADPAIAPASESSAPGAGVASAASAPPAPLASAGGAATTVAVEALPPPDPDPIDRPAMPPVNASVTVAADAVIGIRLDQTISTETARVEDRVTARVTRDVRVDGRTAIPEGATLEGNVTLVERGGRFHDNSRLGVKFTTLVLADRTRVPLSTDTIYRLGESASNEATSKIGASAVVGAILGAVIGGKRGAAIGGSAGAAGGAAAVAAGGPNDAVLQAGMPLTVRLNAPITLAIDRRPE